MSASSVASMRCYFSQLLGQEAEAWQEVEFVRHGRYMDFGVGYHHDAFYVFDSASHKTEWHMHCGPFGTAQQARHWIAEVVGGEYVL